MSEAMKRGSIATPLTDCYLDYISYYTWTALNCTPLTSVYSLDTLPHFPQLSDKCKHQRTHRCMLLRTFARASEPSTSDTDPESSLLTPSSVTRVPRIRMQQALAGKGLRRKGVKISAALPIAHDGFI